MAAAASNWLVWQFYLPFGQVGGHPSVENVLHPAILWSKNRGGSKITFLLASFLKLKFIICFWVTFAMIQALKWCHKSLLTSFFIRLNFWQISIFYQNPAGQFDRQDWKFNFSWGKPVHFFLTIGGSYIGIQHPTAKFPGPEFVFS